jgi:hypothetical protein
VTGSPIRTQFGRVQLVAAADVEPQILLLDDLLALLLRQQMDRLAGDYGGHRTAGRPDHHPLANQLLRIPAADRLRINESVVVDLGHEQADLVAVAREHDPHRARWIEAGDHIPMQVRSARRPANSPAYFRTTSCTGRS